MKRFLMKALIFVILLSLFLVLSFFINQHFFESDFFKPGPEIITLINGDSHAAFSLNPLYIGKSVNVSQEGEPLFISYYKLKFILSQNPQIRNVVLSFSPHNLSAFNDRTLKEKPWVEYIFDRYYPFIDLSDLKGQEINKAQFYKSLVRNQISLNQDYLLNKIKSVLGKGDLRYPYVGNFRHHTSSFLIERRLKKAIDLHYFHNGEICGISTIAEKYLNKIVKLTQNLKVNLYLVNPPLHSEYLKNIPLIYRDEFERIKIKLSSEELVHVYDFGHTELNDTCFFDYNHLNIKGAKLFDSELNNIIYGAKSPVKYVPEILNISAGR